MYFEVLGQTHPTAPTVVLSSGLGGSAKFWQPQLDELTPHFRVIVYDQLGTGRSHWALPDGYSITDMASELITLLDEIAVNKYHLVGHALGGLIALKIAQLRPDCLTSMVLINAWNKPNPHSLRCFEIRKALLANCSKAIFLHMQSLILYPPSWITQNIDLVAAEENHILQSFPNEDNLLKRIQALCEFTIENDQLNNINNSALIIANKDDTLVPWQCSQRLADHLPHSQIQLLDFGGHACTVTASETVNRIILKHLLSHID